MIATGFNRRRGFTLVELTVVLLILALLAVISFPVGSWILAKSRQVACLGNLRDIGAALEHYRSDNNGFWPAMKSMRGDRREEVAVMDTLLLPYVESEKIFCCPADQTGAWEKSGCSYWWYEGVTLQADGTHNYRQLESVFLGTKEAAKIPLILDKEGFHQGSSKINAYYADGHAGPLREVFPAP